MNGRMTPPGPAARSLRRRVLRDALVIAAFLVLTVAMTWPWATDVRRHCPGPGDPYLVSWILWWDAHGTFTQPLRLFDANIFFPHRDTLAFSEHCYGIALPFFPLLLSGVAPLTVHGIAMLAGFALSGFGAFRLARTLTGSTGAGWIAGLAFGFALYRFAQLTHLPYAFTPFMPLILEALVLFAREASRKRAAWLGFAFLMNGLTAVHWLILTALPLLLSGLVLLAPERRLLSREVAVRGGAALALAGLCLVPFLLPYARVAEREGFVRAEAEARFYSAHPSDWVRPHTRIRPWWPGTAPRNRGERNLFPGVAVPLLAAAALVAWRRGRREAWLLGLVWSGVGFLGSLGMNAFFHRFLFAHVPGFAAIRVPARWAMVANLGLALLAGLGALALAERVAARARPFLFAAAGAVLLLDLREAPLQLFRGAAAPDGLARVLKETPMKGGLVELPGGPPRRNFPFVLRAADHGKPLVNAISGFRTKEAIRVDSLFRRRPIPDETLDLLESIPVSYVTVRERWMTPEEHEGLRQFLARSRAAGRLRFAGRHDADLGGDLWAVVKTEGAGVEPPLPWSPGPPGSAVPPASREDESLSCSVDDPGPAADVAGTLLVRGWARLPGEDLAVTIFIDDVARTPDSFQRVARPDVAAVVPSLGDCSTAGYEARFTPGADDAGLHELLVVFRAKDGRVRYYPLRQFTWTK